MPKNSQRRLIVVVAVLVVAAVGLFSLVYISHAYNLSPAGNWQGEYGTGPIQMGGMMGGWSYVSPDQLRAFATSPPVTATNDTLTFGGGSIKILMLMGPMAEGQSMYSFVIDNLTNPTLVIPRGT
ncbi:MAG: hypothetical protein JRM82_00715 [Nitrososphaerota archaeon]|nr:hypothetical protein [Nitrososphaerota archaeon]